MTNPVLDLNFSGSRGLDPRLSFFRASTATYWDESGTLRTAGINQPRIDWDPVTKRCRGLLVEEARTNAVINSEQFNNWSAFNTAVTANATTAPNGIQTADAIMETNTTNLFAVSSSYIAKPSASSLPYTASLFVKANGRTKFIIRLEGTGAASSAGVNFDLSTGTIGQALAGGGFSGCTGTITPVGNGWYRCTVSATTDTNAGLIMRVWLLEPTGNNFAVPTYAGDTTKGLFLWGAQVEQGAWATSYIPTTTAAATRAADTATLDLGLVPEWDSTQGTVVADTQAMAAVNGSMLWSLGGSGSAYVMHSGTTGLQARAATASTTQATITATATQTIPNKTAFAWAADDFALVVNGEVSGSDSAGSAPSVTTLQVGMAPWAYESFLNGWVRRLTLYNRRLANPTLQTLTARSPAIRLRLDALQYLPQEVSFSRASTATFFDSAGVMRVAPTGTPRFDFDPVGLTCRGLLVEEARTNILGGSEDFAGMWTTQNASVTANAATAPDGTTTADLITEDSSSTYHRAQRNAGVSPSTIYTASVFLRKPASNGRQYAKLEIYGFGASNDNIAIAYFDLVGGIVAHVQVGSAAIQNVGGGWFRCSVTATTGTGHTGIAVSVGPSAGTAYAYQGDNASGVLAWGAQVEACGFATSYIPATGASMVTRSADVVSVSLDDLPTVQEGAYTLLAEAQVPVVNTVAIQTLAALTDSGGTNAADIRVPGSQSVRATVQSGGAGQATLVLGSIPVGSPFRVALAAAANDFAASLNGAAVVTDTSGAMPARPTALYLGSLPGGTGCLNGHLREVALWPVRFSNAVTQLLA